MTYTKEGPREAIDDALKYNDCWVDLGTIIEAAQDRLADMDNGWQDMASAPMRESCLIISEFGEIFEAYADKKDLWKAPDPSGGGCSILSGKPTHWRPLPPPPTRKD